MLIIIANFVRFARFCLKKPCGNYAKDRAIHDPLIHPVKSEAFLSFSLCSFAFPCFCLSLSLSEYVVMAAGPSWIEYSSECVRPFLPPVGYGCRAFPVAAAASLFLSLSTFSLLPALISPSFPSLPWLPGCFQLLKPLEIGK